jgi:acetyl esterase/lipase
MLEAQMFEFIKETNAFYPADMASRPVAEQRRLYDRYAAHMTPPRPPGVTVENAVYGESAIAVRAYRDSSGGTKGLVIYLHGGGFVLGGLDSHDMITARLAADIGATVVSVDYRLAPEYPFPAAFEDCLAVARGALDAQMPLMPGKVPVILAGDSAGANLCAAIALDLREQTVEKIAGLILFYPALAPDPTPPACDEHAQAPLLTLAEARWFRKTYLGDRAPTHQSAPLLAESLAGMPPTLLLPAEIDPLRDDAFAFHERLNATGGISELVLGKGLVHGCLRALGRSPGVDGLVDRAVLFARQRLQSAAK